MIVGDNTGKNMRFVKQPSDVLLHGQAQPRTRFHHRPPSIDELDAFARESGSIRGKIPLTIGTARAAISGISHKPLEIRSLVEKIMTLKKNNERKIFVMAMISSEITTGETTEMFLPKVKKIISGEHEWKVPEAVMLLVRFTKNPEEIFSWIGEGNDDTKRAALTALGERIRAGDSLPINLASRLFTAKLRNKGIATDIQQVIDMLAEKPDS